eukprot:364930-Chlamydomonas_euryale.AAC.9
MHGGCNAWLNANFISRPTCCVYAFMQACMHSASMAQYIHPYLYGLGHRQNPQAAGIQQHANTHMSIMATCGASECPREC